MRILRTAGSHAVGNALPRVRFLGRTTEGAYSRQKCGQTSRQAVPPVPVKLYTTATRCLKIEFRSGWGRILREEHRGWRYYSNNKNQVFDGQAPAGCSDFRLVAPNANDRKIDPAGSTSLVQGGRTNVGDASLDLRTVRTDATADLSGES
jgi:hypothetical protein